MKNQIKKSGIAILAIAALSGWTGVARAQEADTNATTIAYWKMNQWSTNIPVGTDLTHGIADLATNAGQGILTGGAAAPASVEDLYVWGAMENNFQIVADAPPASMFNRGFDGGGGSWNSANNLGDGGQMFFPQDQFGNEFAGPSFTEEIFFKSAMQSGTKQTLIWNHQSSAYAHVQLNENGDTGDITFWGWDGANIQTVRVSNGTGRFDDGYWHCAVARFDATSKLMSIYVVNQDGSYASNSITLTANLNPAGANNLYIGRSEGEGDRFNGEINQVRMSSVALANSALLALPGGPQNPHIIAYWQMDAGNVSGTAILDLATNNGQGVLTGTDPVAASVDNLLIEGPLTSGLDFSSAVPPGSMFNTEYPYSGGSQSWNSGQIIALGEGDVVFPATEYGNELPTRSYTEEVFFKENSTQNPAKQTLIFNHRTSAYCILQVNEDGDTGSLLLWTYNGNFIRLQISAAENHGQRFDDGNWHYAACRYDAGTTNLSLYVYNQDGSYVSKSITLGAQLVDNNNPNPTFIGCDEGLGSPFDGLINQVRMSDVALADQELLAVPPPACIPAVVFSSPAPTSSYIDGVANFSVSAGGSSPQLQWRFNGNDIVGQTNTSLTIFPVQTTNGGNYDVVVSTPCSSVTATSAPALLTVIPTTAPVVNTARWRMEAQAGVPNANGNPNVFQGIDDSNIADGQGIYSNGTLSASIDDLITFNGAGGGLVISNDVPPTSMFINGNNGGTGSLDASWIAAVDGGLFYPQDQYGNEFSSQTSFSVELFFKTAGDQSAAGNMELLKQGEVFFRYGLIVNEAAPGAVRFAVNNGHTIQTVDLADANYADGKWHYLLAKYDSLGNAITLTLVNTNGTSSTATAALPAGFSPLPLGNDGNMFIGRNTYPLGQDPRTFLGLIDEIQITSGLVTSTTGQLGFVPTITTPHITSIAVSGGTVTIKFTGAASDSASAFTLVGSGTVNGTYSPLAATITSLGGGSFQATTAVGGSTEFYRIKR